MSTPAHVDPIDLPSTIRHYLTARATREADESLRYFSADAVVTDEGRTFRDTDEVLDFLRSAGAEFSYTTEIVAAHRVDGSRWVVVNHLEGDFPGGEVDLNFYFTISGDRIVALTIGD